MKFNTTVINDLTEKWRQFKKRQERIYLRNINSEEYHELKKRVPGFRGISDTIAWDVWMTEEAEIKKKDLYVDTFEGMLDWIIDGEKD